MNLTNAIVGTERFRLRQGASSVAVHCIFLLVALGAFQRAPKIAAYKLPGAKDGVRLLTYYAAGSPEHAASELASKVTDSPKLETKAPAVQAKTAPEKVVARNVERGAGNTAQSGLGDGEINMAQLTYFPHPKPDLSTLPPGTQGDVVLNAVIDVHGKIADLTLLKGLGHPIDDEVIAEVRTWTYSPATRNGTPVSSEQELHFHYERG